MNRRTFAALMTLASASGAWPALAAELSGPAAGGPMGRPSRGSVVRSVYGVALSPTGPRVGAKAFTELGFNPREAAQLTETAIGIARKARSYDNFLAVIDGKSPSGVTLTARETAMLRSLVARSGGGEPRSRLHQGLDGNTWEGHGGRTWEGRA